MGLQLAATKRIGTAAPPQRILVLMRCSWHAGLQLEVANSIGTAAPHVDSRAARNCSWTLQNALG